MLVKASVLVLPLTLAISAMAGVRTDKPLFLDARPGEDPHVIDVTEIKGTHSKLAVQEYEKAVRDGQKGKRAAAEQHLRAAIEIEPDFFNAHNSLAILLQRSSRYREAEKEYREAVRLNPRSVAPLVNLASLQIEEAIASPNQASREVRVMLNNALASLNEALVLQPGTPLACYLTGVVYYLTNFHEESELYFNKALASGDARVHVAHLALADIYVRLREWENALEHLDAYLKNLPFAPNRKRILAVRNTVATEIGPPRK